MSTVTDPCVFKAERLVRRAREDFSAFASTVIRGRAGRRLELSAIHRSWIAHAAWCRDRGLFAGILAPRGHGKTQLWPIANTLFEIGRNANKRITIVSNSEVNALKRLRVCRAYIDGNVTIARVFPNLVRDENAPWTAHQLFVKREFELAVEPSIEALPLLGTSTGNRADLMIFDDVVDRKHVDEPQRRARATEVFEEQWIPCLEEDGFALLIGTLWHPDDLYHYLMTGDAAAGWCFMIQGIADDLESIDTWILTDDESHPLIADGQAVRTRDPYDGFHRQIQSWWTRKTLIRRRSKIGKEAFERSYQNRMPSTSSRRFASVMRAFDTSIDYPAAADLHRPSDVVAVSIGVDPASDKRPGTAIIAAGVLPNGRKRCLWAEVGRFTYPQLIRRLIVLRNLLDAEIVMVETNSQQSAIIDCIRDIADNAENDEFRRLAGELLSVVAPWLTGTNKFDDKVGLPGLAVEFENNVWIIPAASRTKHGRLCRAGDSRQKCSSCRLLAGLEDYPNTLADADAVMGLWFARNGLQRVAPVGGAEAFTAVGRARGEEMAIPAAEFGDIGIGVGGDLGIEAWGDASDLESLPSMMGV